jgi:AcrR family transcriptional regulator
MSNMSTAVRQARDIAGKATARTAAVRDTAVRKTIRSVSHDKNDRHDKHDKSVQETKRDLRRLELVEAAITVIRRDGPGASMDQMAAEAGVTKPILYRHFGDRAGLVAAIGQYAFDLVSQALDSALHAEVTARQLVASTIDSYLQFIESDPAVYRFLVHRTITETADPGSVLNEYISRTARQVALVLGEGLRSAGFDSGPAEPWAFGIVGMVHSAGDWWLDRGSMPRSRLAEYLTSLVYDGLPNFDELGSGGTGMPERGHDAHPESTNLPITIGGGTDLSMEGSVTPLIGKQRRTS